MFLSLVFGIAMNAITEYAGKGLMNKIMYDLVFISESTEKSKSF